MIPHADVIFEGVADRLTGAVAGEGWADGGAVGGEGGGYEAGAVPGPG